MSFYVKRRRDYRVVWTGPIETHSQAGREARAWREAGWATEILPTPEVTAEVRAWEQANRRGDRRA